MFKKKVFNTPIAVAIASIGMLPSLGHAVTLDMGENIEGSFNSTITLGLGVRMKSPNCDLVGDPNSSCGASANVGQWSAGDNGNLNYKKGDLFTAYLKGTHEILVSKPEEGLKFMARGTWMKDFAAADTRRTDLSDDARAQIVNNMRLLDLWMSKEFSIGDQRARVRVGNQVINWGESLFALGGINATNALDFQRLMTPGAQIKEAVLPAPMVSFASSLGSGFNVEAYYQFMWNRNLLPPAGSYFSTGDYIGKGREAVPFNGYNANLTGQDAASLSGLRSYNAMAIYDATGGTVVGAPIQPDLKPSQGGQYGLALHYKPTGGDYDFGFYFLNYHDKSPVLNLNNMGSEYQWEFLKNRQLFGVSMNTQIGNWAIGSELSYRPRDAVTLSACYGSGGALDFQNNGALVANCPQYIDNKRYQFLVTGMLNLNPSDHGWVLDPLGADGGFLSVEAVVINYPGISKDKRITRNIGGMMVDQVPMAGYLIFLDRNTINAGTTPIAAGGGTATSWGYTIDFNWTYDGRLIPGWQVTPGVTFSHSVKGDTPSVTANYLEGAKAANFYVMFNQNPTVWQAGLNYATYFGGKSDPLRQVFKDRDFLGAFVSRNF
ncbi:MAG: DUF1302 domain-containing protein [Betaproteobacteria bacterium]|nr:DUF1302 domain-containing protein [Betaproteobacteria bacterium]